MPLEEVPWIDGYRTGLDTAAGMARAMGAAAQTSHATYRVPGPRCAVDDAMRSLADDLAVVGGRRRAPRPQRWRSRSWSAPTTKAQALSGQVAIMLLGSGLWRAFGLDINAYQLGFLFGALSVAPWWLYDRLHREAGTPTEDPTR